MAAELSGAQLGLFGNTLNPSGGGALVGRGNQSDSVYINSTTGNLVIQGRDEYLSAIGPDLSLIRTYNSQGQFTDDNGDNWRLSPSEKVFGLLGTLNTAGSSIRKVFGDGADILYTYNATLQKYQSTDGDGAHDTLSYDTATQRWTWIDGSARNGETYDWINGSGKLLNTYDTERDTNNAPSNVTTYGYNASGLLTSITDSAGLQVTSFTYSGTNLTQISVSSQGQTQIRTRYYYDNLNRLSQVVVDLDLIPDTTPLQDANNDGYYDTVNGQTYVTHYAYEDTSKRIKSITQGDGTTISFTYEPAADGSYRVKTYTDGLARVTSFSYSGATTVGSGSQTVAANLAALNTADPQHINNTYNLNSSALSTTDTQNVSNAYNLNNAALSTTDTQNVTNAYNRNDATLSTTDTQNVTNIYNRNNAVLSTTDTQQVSNNYSLNTSALSTTDTQPVTNTYGLATGQLTTLGGVTGYTVPTGATWQSLASTLYGVNSAAAGSALNAVYGNASLTSVTPTVLTGLSQAPAGTPLGAVTTTTTSDPAISAGVISSAAFVPIFISYDPKGNPIYDWQWQGQNRVDLSDVGGGTRVVLEYATASGNYAVIDQALSGASVIWEDNIYAGDGGVSGVLAAHIYDANGHLVRDTGGAITHPVITWGTAGFPSATFWYEPAGSGAWQSVPVGYNGNFYATLLYLPAGMYDYYVDFGSGYTSQGQFSTDGSTAQILSQTNTPPPYVAVSTNGSLIQWTGQAGDSAAFRYWSAGGSPTNLTVNSSGSTFWVDLAGLNTASYNFDLTVSRGGAVVLQQQGSVTANRRLTSLPSTLSVTTPQTVTVAPYYTIPSGATWQSIANTIYGVNNAAAGSALQTAMGNPPLTTGNRLTNLPATLTVTTTQIVTVPAYYTIPTGATWQSIANTIYGINSTAAGSALQTAMGNPPLTAGNRLTNLPATLSVTTTQVVTVPAYFTIPTGATWQSIANTIYGINSAAAGSALQAALGNPPLTAGNRLTNLPGTLTVTTTQVITVPPYYTIPSGATWSSIAQAVYGVSGTAAGNALQTAMGNPALTAGNRLTNFPATLTVSSTQIVTVPPYFTIPASATWSSVVNTLYGVSSIVAAGTLQTVLGNPPLTAGSRLTNLPATLNVQGYYVVPANPSWANVTQTIYGTTNSNAVDKLQSVTGNPALTPGMHLAVPASLTYAVTGSTTFYLQTDITDPANPGNPTTYLHDTRGRLVRALSAIANGVRLRTDYTYDADGNVTSITEDPSGLNRVTTLEYDTKGNLLLTRDSLGDTVTRTYSATNQLLTETKYLVPDPDGAGPGQPSKPQTTRYIYDSEEHLRFVVEEFLDFGTAIATARVTEYGYNTVGQRVASLSYAGDVFSVLGLAPTVALTESDLQSLTTNTQELARVRRVDYAYDFRGNLTSSTAYSATDSSGGGIFNTASITHYIYDQRGQLLQSIDARNAAITLDPANPNRNPNANTANATTYVYDGLGRLTATTQWLADRAPSPVTRSTIVSYDDVGNSVVTKINNNSIADRGGTTVNDSDDVTTLVATSVYDTAGNLVSTTSRDNNPIIANRVTLSQTRYFYDVDNRLVMMLVMMKDLTGVHQHVLYDAAGRKAADVDGAGALTEYVYNAASEIVKTIRYATRIDPAQLIDSVGNPTSVSLDTLRTQANVAPADNRISRAIYDAAGRLVYTIDPVGALTQNVYDGAGNITDTIQYATPVTAVDEVLPSTINVVTNAADRRTRYFYYGNGMQQAKLDAEGFLTSVGYTANTLQPTHIYNFARAADRSLRASGTVEELFADVVNNATADEQARLQHTFRFYDGQSRLIGELDAEGYFTETHYDLAGNVSQVSRYDKQLVYGTNGNTYQTLQAAAAVAGVIVHTTTREYDGADRLFRETMMQGTVGGGTASSITTYVYDKVGNLLSTTSAQGTADERTTQTRYDALGRVKQELSGEGTVRLLANDDVETTWSRYGITYEYDKAGRRISATTNAYDLSLPLSTQNPQPSKTYYYNEDNQLRFTVNTLGQVSENRYDGLGRVSDSISYAATIATDNLTGGLVDATITARVAAVANPRKDAHTTIRYQFFATGQIREETRTTSAEGAQTFDDVDVFGDLRKHITDIDARELVHNYDYDHRGLRTFTAWDSTGVNQTETDTYDAFGRLTSKTDQYNNKTSMAYDHLGRVIATTDPMRNTHAMTYDAFARALTMTDARQNVTTYTYNDANRAVMVKTPQGITVTTIYDAPGQTVRVEDGNKNVTRYSYDKNGQLIKATDGLSTSYDQPLETRTYDSAGRLITTTAASGAVTRLGYDAASRTLTRTVTGDGLTLTTTYNYDDANHTIDVVDPNGVHTVTSYDRDGRVTDVVVDPSVLKLHTTYAYDLAGHVVTVTEGAGSDQPRVTKYIFDVLGRRTDQVVDPGSGTNAATGNPYLNLTTHYDYDANGNVVAKTEGVGTADVRTTRYVYDSDSRLTYTIDAANGVTATTYDQDSHVAGVRRYASTINLVGLPLVLTPSDITPDRLSATNDDRLESYGYDKDGRQIYTINALGGLTQKDYDANGNVIRTVMYARPFAGGVSSSAADVKTTYWGSTTPAITSDDRVQWTVYDQRNLAAYSVDAYGAVTRSEYDNVGNVTKTTAYAKSVAVDSGNNISTAGTYGTALNAPADALKKDALDVWANDSAVATDAANHVTRHWYDALNRLRFTLDAEGYLTETHYDYAPRKTTTVVYVTKPSKTEDLAKVIAGTLVRDVTITLDDKDQKTVTTYDAAGRVSIVEDAKHAKEYYGYDAQGNKIWFTNKKGSGPQDAAYTWNYEYDANGRLLEEASPNIDFTIVSEVPAEFGGTTLGATLYNKSVRTRMTYDALGNVKTRTEAYLTKQARTTTYEYDALGRQIKTTFPGIQTLSSETAYDTLGNAFRNRDVADGYSYKVYDKLGRVQYEIDAENFVTEYSYDTFGNQTTLTRHANALTSALPIDGVRLTSADITSDPTRLVADTVADRTITTTYDRLNRVRQVTKPSVYNYVTTKDTSGGQTFSAASTTITQYNAFGQVALQRELINPLTNSYADTYLYYDRRGLKTGQVDPLGYLTVFEYDETGDLTRELQYGDALNAGDWSTSSYGTPPLATVNSPLSRETRYTYDQLNRRRTETKIAIQFDFVVDNAFGVAETRSTTDDQVTQYEYDALGNQTSVTINGGTTYSYYDTLGRVIAVAEPTRDRGDASTLTPLTVMHRDAFGNLVEQIQYGRGAASAPSVGSLPLGATEDPTGPANRRTLTLYDNRGHALRTIDPAGIDRQIFYNTRGDIALDEQANLYYYDKLGHQTMVVQQLGISGPNSSPVEVRRQMHYNAFGEIDSKGIVNFNNSGESWQEHFEYDQAGRLWRTNTGDGVYKVYLYNLQGQSTAEIRSRQHDLKTYVASAEKALALPVDEQMRTETVYDILGRVVEQRQPSFQPLGGVDQITATFGIDTFGSSPYLHWNAPFGPPVTMTFEYRLAGSNNAWSPLDITPVITTEIGPTEIGVNLAGLISDSRQYEYRVFYKRVEYTPGGQIPADSEATGTFKLTTSTVTTLGITPGGPVGGVSVSAGSLPDTHVGLFWSVGPDEGGGTWQVKFVGQSTGTTALLTPQKHRRSHTEKDGEGQIDIVVDGFDFWVGLDDSSRFPTDTYTYQITQTESDRLLAAASGSVSITASTSTSGIVDGFSLGQTQVPGPVSATTLSAPSLTYAITSREQIVSIFITRDACGNPIYDYQWSGVNTIALHYTGAGAHAVVNYYMADGFASGNEPPDQQDLPIAADGTISWTAESDLDYGGVGVVTSITVYDAVGNVVASTGATLAVPALTWDNQPAADVFEIDYSPAGQNSWASQTLFSVGPGGYSAVLPTNLRGLYDYRLHYLRLVGDESGLTTQEIASSSGQFSFDGATMQIVGHQINSPIPLSYYDPLKEFYWLAVPGADVEFTVKEENNGNVYQPPLRYSSGYHYYQFVDFLTQFSNRDGKYTFTIRYRKNGVVVAENTGSITFKTTVQPATVALSGAGAAPAPIGGFVQDASNPNVLRWSPASDTGVTVEFRYRPAGTSGYSVTLPAGTTSFDFSGVSGAVDFEVRYVRSDGVMSAAGGGSANIARPVTVSGAVVDTTAASLSASAAIPSVKQTFDRWGNVSSRTDQGRQTTKYRYNQFDQLTETLSPSAGIVVINGGQITLSTGQATTKNHYDLYGQLIATTDANGNVNGHVYNMAGQLIKEKHADGGVKSTVYDAFGEKVQITDEASYRTRNVYDGDGRLTAVGHEVGNGGFASTNPYDLSGRNSDSVIVDQYQYDRFGHRTAETNGEGKITTHQYDIFGNVIFTQMPTWTDADGVPQGGRATSTAYDAQGRKIAEGNGSAFNNWTYDYFGRLESHLDMGNTGYSYVYDHANLLTSQTSTLGQHQTFTYDTAGHLTHIEDRSVDIKNKPVSGRYPSIPIDIDGVTRDTTYGYDTAGRRARETTVNNGYVIEDTYTYYDALNRVGAIYGARYNTTYSYDAAGNRTHVVAYYYNYANLFTRQVFSYAYDSMNRVVADVGYDGNNDGIDFTPPNPNVGGPAVDHVPRLLFGYDARGLRTMELDANKGNVNTGVGTAFMGYDGLGRLIRTDRVVLNPETELGYETTPESTRQYDRASRLKVLREYLLTASSADEFGTPIGYHSTLRREQRTEYNDDGTVSRQAVYSQNVLQSEVKNYSYSEDGVPLSYDVADYVNKNSSNHTIRYRVAETVQETQHEVRPYGGQPGGISKSIYNVDGELVRFVDTQDQNKNRYYANNASGQTVLVVQGSYGNDGGTALVNAMTGRDTTNASHAQRFLFANGQLVGNVGKVPGQSGANFDVNYTPISDQFPSSVPAQYTVQAGDTLHTVAMRLFGDAALWYVIADANGLSDPEQKLDVGLTLRIPSKVVALSNTASNFKPFDPRAAIGDTTPTLAPPPPKSGGGCGVIGMIIVIIVMIVVTVFTAGAAAAALGAVWGTVGAGGFAAAVVGGAIGAAAGSIVSQGVGIAIGAQDKFSWSAVGKAAIGGAIGGALFGVSGFDGASVTRGALKANWLGNAFGNATPYVQAGLNNAAASVLTQGLSVATGLQDKFSWRDVAASAAGGVAGYAAGQALGPALAHIGNETARNIVGHTLSGFASGVTQAVVHGGKIDVVTIAADAFGNAIGNSIARAMTPKLKPKAELEEIVVTADPPAGGTANSSTGATAAGTQSDGSTIEEVVVTAKKVNDGVAITEADIKDAKRLNPSQLLNEFEKDAPKMEKDVKKLEAKIDKLKIAQADYGAKNPDKPNKYDDDIAKAQKNREAILTDYANKAGEIKRAFEVHDLMTAWTVGQTVKVNGGDYVIKGKDYDYVTTRATAQDAIASAFLVQKFLNDNYERAGVVFLTKDGKYHYNVNVGYYADKDTMSGNEHVAEGSPVTIFNPRGLQVGAIWHIHPPQSFNDSGGGGIASMHRNTHVNDDFANQDIPGLQRLEADHHYVEAYLGGSDGSFDFRPRFDPTVNSAKNPPGVINGTSGYFGTRKR